jgi:hypothetical protein
MASIFISYRRMDSMAHTGRIYDRLVQAFGARNVFKDVDDIPPGVDFRKVLDTALTAADIVLVIIGPRWLMATDDQGKRRLLDPDDFVRMEVEAALQRNDVLVIPVLVDNAPMPSAESLPPTLRDLAFRNSVVVRNDPDFNRDISNLIKAVQRGTKAPSRLPLLAGIIAAVAVIIAALALLASQGGTPSTTATPTEAALLVTDEPTAEPSATTAPTDTIAPTEEASATATTEPTAELTAEPTPEAAVDLTPTVLYPDGRALMFYYNSTSFYVSYTSSGSIPFASLKFEALDTSGQPVNVSFSGVRWTSFQDNLFRNGCGALEPVQFGGFLEPDACLQYNARVTNLSTSEQFWRAGSGQTQFRVLWNDEEVGRCALDAGTCEVRIPPR